MKKYTAKQVIAIAQAEIGYHEKATNAQLDDKTANSGSNNYTKYARDLFAAGYYNGNKQGYAWCDVWHDWCHFKASGEDAAYAQEVTCQNGPYGAGCSWSASYYKNAGRFYTKNPQPGDQIFFGDGDHTGIVESVTATTVTTIEGNAGNMVCRKTYSLNDSYIDGYGRPRYASEEEVNPAPTPAPADPVLETIKAYFADLNDNDCGDWSTQAREWAIKNKLIVGIGSMKDGTPNYAWEAPITREQLVTILYRYAGLIGKQ